MALWARIEHNSEHNSSLLPIGRFREGGFTLHPRAIFAGSNLSSTLAITDGWCSPALPTYV